MSVERKGVRLDRIELPNGRGVAEPAGVYVGRGRVGIRWAAKFVDHKAAHELVDAVEETVGRKADDVRFVRVAGAAKRQSHHAVTDWSGSNWEPSGSAWIGNKQEKVN